MKPSDNDLLTVSEVGECLGLSAPTIIYHCDACSIRSIRTFSGMRLVTYREVKRYAKERGILLRPPTPRLRQRTKRRAH